MNLEILWETSRTSLNTYVQEALPSSRASLSTKLSDKKDN